ncbi:FkbM family methyltransferase [Alteromonas oceani]|uniref:FkbM family methyltransferase n=1 Tax=Alteromonas oceani TaxID=2071609 RepID=A0ABV7JQI2_9ALTE|nr:FkbM family methyltransferase [Alteromonas oceani]
MSNPKKVIIAGLNNIPARNLVDYLLKTDCEISLLDDGLVGQSVFGIPIVSIQTALVTTNEQAVIAIFSPRAFSAVSKKLRKKGLCPVSIEEFVIEHDLPREIINFPANQDIASLTDVGSFFNDRLSKLTLNAIRDYWHSGDRAALTDIQQSIFSIYFNESFLASDAMKVFVDVGAYDGDSYSSALDYFTGIEEAHLFEPLQSIDKSQLKNSGAVNVYSVCLGRDESMVSFTEQGLNSHSSKDGSISVMQKTLDSFQLNPTFIKVDVEGQDIEVLHGAESTLQHSKPVIALSVYHRPEHLRQALELLSEKFNYQRFYLRKYSSSNDETVLYAVP